MMWWAGLSPSGAEGQRAPIKSKNKILPHNILTYSLHQIQAWIFCTNFLPKRVGLETTLLICGRFRVHWVSILSPLEYYLWAHKLLLETGHVVFAQLVTGLWKELYNQALGTHTHTGQDDIHIHNTYCSYNPIYWNTNVLRLSGVCCVMQFTVLEF